MSKKKPETAPVTTPQLNPPVCEPWNAEEKQAAEHTGKSVLALRLFLASGLLQTGPWAMYHETVGSLAEVGQAFGVSERTAASWKAKGMPTTADGRYVLPAIRSWRLAQPEPPEWLTRGSQGLQATEARGDLARAILRWVRTELVEAGRRVAEDFFDNQTGCDAEESRDILCALMARHFEGFRLSDAEIEKLLAECWNIV